MKILNIGSLNIDYVYSVDHIILPGETEATVSREVFLGGKGMNQSCALAKAGAEVWHAGLIGSDGKMFLDACREYGVHSEFIRTIDGPSGHTVIQIDRNAQNSILLYGGANRRLTESFVDEALAAFSEGDILLLQNEVNLLPYIVDRAYEKGLRIALNPSPYNSMLDDVDMNKIGIFLLNEVEGFQLTGKTEPEAILTELCRRFPHAAILLTLGKLGAIYTDGSIRLDQPIYPVKAADTTAAGDTFTGYFLAGFCEDLPMEQILRRCAMASAIAVSRHGAVPSIPWKEEVLQALSAL